VNKKQQRMRVGEKYFFFLFVQKGAKWAGKLRKEEKVVKNVKKRKMGQNVQFWAGEAATRWRL